MAIHEVKKQTDIEKRLKLLRQQIYGKESKWEVKNLTSHLSHPTSNAVSIRADISYLYHDLVKIGILSGLVIGAQIILFILVKSNNLRINFF